MYQFDFKIKRMDNLKFDFQELLDYYNTLEEKYQHMKWAVADVYTPDSNPIDKSIHHVDGFYNWAIQSDLKDPTKPCPAYKEGVTEEMARTQMSGNYDVPTELIFGFGKKIVDYFANIQATQALMVVHPPETRLGFHVDTGDYVKIHFPVKTNSESFFEYEDEKFLMEPGYAYLTNVSVPHATINGGDTDRVHLIFRVPEEFTSYLETHEFSI
jgi:hypothetical protein